MARRLSLAIVWVFVALVNIAAQPASDPGAIAGRVFDVARRPIAHAAVSAVPARLDGGLPQPGSTAATTQTGENGDYRLDRLPAGRYYVSVSVVEASDNRQAKDGLGFGPTFYPGTPFISQATFVALGAGEEVAAVDVLLERKRLARISGLLLGGRRPFLDGAHVALNPSAGYGTAGLSAPLSLSRISADGTFVLDRVPPGEYVLQARSISLSTVNEIARTGRSAPLTRDPDAEFGKALVRIDGYDIDGLAIKMSPAPNPAPAGRRATDPDPPIE